MTLEKRIEAFAALGYAFRNMSETERSHWIDQAQRHNPWFTPESTQQALEALQPMLDGDNLRRWTKGYALEPTTPKQVGVVMAGNLPLVGFHDMLSVLIAGHTLLAKPSTKDPALPRMVIKELNEIAPELGQRVTFAEEPMKTMDAVIATGSNNSARYFETYFGKYPHIIRKNRTSVAVLRGQESTEEMIRLGHDVLQYFGLGCRNVSKLFVPKGYNFTPLLDSWQEFKSIIHHSKYSNNYDYHRSIMLVNRTEHLDTGFLMVKQDERLAAPTSMIFYEEYADTYALADRLAADDENIQCLVGKGLDHPRAVGFGKSQTPQLWDYADGVDTLDFLSKL